MSEPPTRRRDRLFALLLFAASLAVRVLFWRATPDAAWPYAAGFKGDAAIWLEYASAIRSSEPFELGLPIHPPGAAYAIALLWNGEPSGVPSLRFVWCLLGAAIPPVLFLAARRSFGRSVADLAGALAAASTGLILLSASLNVETPYLLLVCVSLLFVEDLVRSAPRLRPVVLFSALNAAACLFRVEHVLFFALALVFFFALWSRPAEAEAKAARRERARPGRVLAAAPAVAVAAASFLLPILPWQAKAWTAIRRFNRAPQVSSPAEEAALGGVERSLAAMPWAPDALRRRDALPAFARRTSSLFVAATVAHRGAREVRGEDFRVLEEAFGYVPRPLARFPFVSSYGPLNFSLANHEGAHGGFDASPLHEPPPLAGGAERYPAFLVRGLPPPRLAFVYPPHLRLFNDGYAIGATWIAGHPADFARLAARKLSIFWSGAALGYTGYGFPLGLSGVRRAVDLVVPDPQFSAGAAAWRLGMLAAAGLGLAAGWRRVAIWPWLLLLATRVAATVLFFGYARQGAAAVPVVVLLVALAVERWALPRSSRAPARAAAIAGAVLALSVVVEAARFASHPALRLDGQALGAGDPFPAALHVDQRLEVR